mmetsp:Transcript_38716/g.95277  ORF Transcript_38716/g.95277 Transcript_38716/m.95277 type:complete len:286 (-) Transcript_38716:147-1004(-)
MRGYVCSYTRSAVQPLCTGGSPPVRIALSRLCGAIDRYVTMQNPPNDCPNTPHFCPGPSSAALIASQSLTMLSARILESRPTRASVVLSSARVSCVTGWERPVPRWSRRITRWSWSARLTHPLSPDTGLPAGNPGPPCKKRRTGRSLLFLFLTETSSLQNTSILPILGLSWSRGTSKKCSVVTSPPGSSLEWPVLCFAGEIDAPPTLLLVAACTTPLPSPDLDDSSHDSPAAKPPRARLEASLPLNWPSLRFQPPDEIMRTPPWRALENASALRSIEQPPACREA